MKDNAPQNIVKEKEHISHQYYESIVLNKNLSRLSNNSSEINFYNNDSYFPQDMQPQPIINMGESSRVVVPIWIINCALAMC